MPSSERPSLHEKALARVGTTVQEKYRITRLLGMGGMAAVYAAVHRNGHPVAIKFLLDQHVHDSAMYRLFRREAYVANRVGHPGAVPVLDDDADDKGGVFLIMPLLEGETLRARWERMGRRLPLLEVMVCMLDVLDVLAAAHAKGIVHRDIKPDNLFLTTKGEVRVLDFGIARNVDPGSVTMTGRVMGTPAFMPPEQALGEYDAVGPHSDCWAVGATMFTLLSGQFVHATESAPAQLAAAATRRARALAEVAPETPPAIAQLVDKALTFERPARWASAEEMRDALVKIVEAIVGESVGQVTARVRSEIASQLSPGAAEQEETRAPHRTVPDVATLQPVRVTASRNHELRWALWLAGMTLLVIGIIVWSQPRVARPKMSSVPDNKLAIEVATGDSSSIDSKAQVYLQAGLQSLRDASPGAARKAFERAIEIDPRLAAAHLYASMPPMEYFPVWIGEAERAHYHAALAQRSQLSTRDRVILEAFSPLMSTPPDMAKAETRLEEVSARFPSDWLVLSALGYVRLARGASAQAVEIFDELLAGDPSMALGWDGRADGFRRQGDTSMKRDSLEECLRRVPHSERCLMARLFDAMGDGRCTDADRDARALIAMPDGPRETASDELADAIWARGGTVESVHTTLVQTSKFSSEERREVMLVWGEARMYALSGEFAKSQDALDLWRKTLTGMKSDLQHVLPNCFEVRMAMELGNRELAGRIATNYLAKREAWFRSQSYVDGDIDMLVYQYRAGSLSYQQFEAQRSVWLDRTVVDRHLPANRRWVDAYARAVMTPKDAVIALAKLPRYLPIVNSFETSMADDDAIGLVYLLVDDVESSLRYLRNAVKSCSALHEPFAYVQAHLHLGQALEQKGDVPGACAAYSVVLQRWGKEPRSVSAKAARERHRALHCAAVTP